MNSGGVAGSMGSRVQRRWNRDTSPVSYMAISPSRMSSAAGRLAMATARLGEPSAMVDPTPADEAHVAASLVRKDPPAVDLLLVHPPGPMEGRRRGRDDAGNLRKAGKHHYPFSMWPMTSRVCATV